MLSADYLSTIRSDGRRILDLARSDPSRPVPQYPNWEMIDLANHLASIHGRTTLICREHPTQRPSAPHLPEGVGALDWYEANLEVMLTALEESDPDTPVWGFWPSPSIGLWERRMVIETGIHRWDAEQAWDEERPLLDAVAIAGLDEFSDMWLPRLPVLPTISITATDLDRSWVFGEGQPVVNIEGSASGLYLRLMSRPGVGLPAEWAAAVDALEPPSR